MYVISPTPAVRRIMDLTGVSITVPIVGSVEEALATADAGPGSEPPATTVE